MAAINRVQYHPPPPVSFCEGPRIFQKFKDVVVKILELPLYISILFASDSKLSLFLGLPLCRRSSLLTGGDQILRLRECLALYKTFNTLPDSSNPSISGEGVLRWYAQSERIIIKTHSKTIALQDYRFYLLVFYLSLLLFTVPRHKTIVLQHSRIFLLVFL